MKPLLALALLLAFNATAQEWTRFRGPNGTGISQAKSIPSVVSDSDINWKVELPGTGHSSPVLWGNRIFVTVTGDKSGGLSLLCLDATEGKVLWKHDFALNPFPRHQFNSYASSTPCVDAHRVYVVWNEPDHLMLAALNHKGEPQWERDFGPFVSQHGCGISPILYRNLVVLGNEQDDAKFVKESKQSGKSFITAVDAKSGKSAWQTPRDSAVVSYTTPCIYEPGTGKNPAIIFHSQSHGIYAVDPKGGKVLWELGSAFDKRTVSSPLLAGDLILGSCGSGGGGNYAMAIRPPASAQGGKKPEMAWQLKQSMPYVPTGIVHGDLAWLWSDSGILSCVEASTGKLRYQERVGGDYFGSVVWINSVLYCVTTSGDLVTVEASDQFKVLGRYPLRDTCHSTAAVALDHLFVRTKKYLWSIGGKGRKANLPAVVPDPAL
jgi:outer membrane protein assembly factor BamB